MKEATTRKGAKGTSDFIVFFPRAINPIPITAPMVEDKKRVIKILGKPSKRPRKKINLTSPKPNHLPLEIKKIARKNKVAPIAAGKELYTK